MVAKDGLKNQYDPYYEIGKEGRYISEGREGGERRERKGKVQREEKGQFSVKIQTRTWGGGPLASSRMRLRSNWEMKIQKQSVTIRVNGKP